VVTVAWELSWYQWEVDTRPDGKVRELAKGDEVAELDEASQAWNGAAGDDGRLRLAD
jgi:hypothetical protein